MYINCFVLEREIKEILEKNIKDKVRVEIEYDDKTPFLVAYIDCGNTTVAIETPYVFQLPDIYPQETLAYHTALFIYANYQTYILRTHFHNDGKWLEKVEESI